MILSPGARIAFASLLIALTFFPPSIRAVIWPPVVTSITQVVPMEATVSTSPLSITLKFARAGSYEIYRKAAYDTTWSASAVATLPANSTSWTDTAVTEGVLYEYKAVLFGAGVTAGAYWANSNPVGHILSGIKVDQTQPRGRLVLVVTTDVQTELAPELAQYKADLIADGWMIHEIPVAPMAKYDAYGIDTNADGIADSNFPAEHIALRNQIIAVYNAYPGEVKNVVILGRAPVARTGLAGINPDGHGERCTLAADAYYADVNGTWTDTGNNYYPMTYTDEVNGPGDNRFDATKTTQTGPVEMGFGRIDISNGLIFEKTGLRTYLGKLHRYKTAAADFRPGRKVAIRDGFSNVEETGWATGPAVSGMANVDAFDIPDLPAVPSGNDADQAYAAQHGPYLFYFKGSGSPAFSNGGKAVFWTGMQSHWGFWWEFTKNQMPRRLGDDDFTLSFTWSIWGVRYFYHRMAMGLDAGDMMRVSINNVSPIIGTYSWSTADVGNGNYSASLFMSHMGDPTLRLFMFEPPADLGVQKISSAAQLTWTASPASGVIGYHVYRSAVPEGPFVRVTTTPVAGTQFTDSIPATGAMTYMVRAVRLEVTGSGSFFNASLGIVRTIDFDQPAAPLQVPAAVLADARYAQPYTAALMASGGIPAYAWSLTGGSLPEGLLLATNGVISGTPVRQGAFTFTVQATDRLGATSQNSYTITTLSDQAIVLSAALHAATSAASPTVNYAETESFTVDTTKDGYLGFDLSSLPVRNAFTKATLRIAISPTSSSSYGLLEAALLDDSGDTIAQGLITFSNAPTVNTAFATSQAAATALPGTFVDIDVTAFLQETLKNDPAKILGLKLTTKSISQSITYGGRRAFGDQAPRLIVEATDAPKISLASPATGSAFLQPGTGLQLEANVSPLSPRTASLTWSKIAGPGSITFGSFAAAVSTATFSTPGDYTLRLDSDDGTLRSSRTVAVRVFGSPVLGPVTGLQMRLAMDEASGTVAGDGSGGTPANQGNLANGTLAGPLPSWAPSAGKFGGAMVFNGTDQRIQIPDNSSRMLDGGTAISFSFWLNAAAIDTNYRARAILCKRTKAAVDESYTVVLINNRVTVNIGTYASANRLSSATSFVAGRWYHVAVTFDAALPSAQRLKLYVNGAPDKFLSTAQTAVPRFTSPLYVGGYDPTNTNASFNGSIDEVRVYNRALSQSEITALASASPANMAPVITGTTAFTGSVGQSFLITAGVSDDALPGSPLAMNWMQVNGPSSLAITDAFSSSANAFGSVVGVYGLRLTASDGDVTSFADFSATLTGFTYAGWAAAHSLTGENAMETATPDNDGVPNLLKFATGLEPGAPSQTRPAVLSESANHLVLQFSRLSPAPLNYVVEASQDLVTWTPVASLSSGVGTWTGTAGVNETGTGNLRAVNVTDSISIDSQPRRFLRLKVSVAP